MKKLVFALTLIFCLALASCASTQATTPATTSQPEVVVKDFASELEFDLFSSTAKQEVTLKAFVDGDTTHFYVPTSVNPSGVLKARYLAVNTPETSGKIEEYGKKAASYTKSKLESATSIYIESDTSKWDIDSTGDRYLVWVWYKNSETDTYRNLNLELLQNGLAIASSSANNRYGSICMAAIAQAKQQKVNIYSGQKDPDFYYGDAIELTLRELRTNLKEYEGKKVAFEGIVTKNGENSVFVEDFDSESGLYFGMTVYYGFNLSGAGLEILQVGNRVRIVGTLQYYENGDSYQVSGLTYRQMKPNDPGNIQKISSGHQAAYALIDPKDYSSLMVELIDEDGQAQSFALPFLIMDTSVSMKDLKVEDVYVGSDHVRLTCSKDGAQVLVVTYNTPEAKSALGKVVDIYGIASSYAKTYEIKVYDSNDFVVKEKK